MTDKQQQKLDKAIDVLRNAVKKRYSAPAILAAHVVLDLLLRIGVDGKHVWTFAQGRRKHAISLWTEYDDIRDLSTWHLTFAKAVLVAVTSKELKAWLKKWEEKK